MKRYFIITVDTEGDDLWSWSSGEKITTKNASYIPRFQNLCEEYGLKPVYLVNYEMITDDSFVEYIKSKVDEEKCEVGLHIHAWNSPPAYELPNIYGGNSFITEYPLEVQKRKITLLKSLITEKIGVAPVSFRSGRWACNEQLFNLLNELGFLIDCSITPEISHYNDIGCSVNHGNDRVYDEYAFQQLCGDLYELPMTTAKIRTWNGTSIKNRVKNIILGKKMWLRPATSTFEEMKMLCKIIEKKDVGYLEFMIHSSELMPGGSPYTKDSIQLENFYNRTQQLFEYISKDYVGVTLSEYYNSNITKFEG